MNLKTYTARSMNDALALVRKELGADAVILHTRSYKRGGLFGIGAKPVVEITAGNGREIGRYRKQEAERDRAKRLAAVARPSAVAAASADRVEITAGDLIRRTYAAAKAELEKSQPLAPPPSPAAPAGVTVVTAPPSPQADQLAEEMQAVKRMVAHMMRQQKAASPAAGPDVPERLMDQYLALLQQEVAEELAEEVVQDVRERLEGSDLEDSKACRGAVAGAIAELLPVDPTAGTLQPTGDHRPRVIALVGPTGVGKTTTVAKLAATFKLKQNKKVALITLDTYRIAAVDQLRTYASIIGVPLHVVLAPDDLRRAIGECAGFDAVLIDTAGRSQRDDHRLDELAKFLDAAQPHEVHLVLSSTCSQSVLMEAIERFSRIRTDRIIFTKLDEAVSFGVLLNVLRKVNKKLSYITTGQEVPHQIEPGNSARLAALVLGEGAVAP